MFLLDVISLHSCTSTHFFSETEIGDLRCLMHMFDIPDQLVFFKRRNILVVFWPSVFLSEQSVSQ